MLQTTNGTAQFDTGRRLAQPDSANIQRGIRWVFASCHTACRLALALFGSATLPNGMESGIILMNRALSWWIEHYLDESGIILMNRALSWWIGHYLDESGTILVCQDRNLLPQAYRGTASNSTSYIQKSKKKLPGNLRKTWHVGYCPGPWGQLP